MYYSISQGAPYGPDKVSYGDDHFYHFDSAQPLLRGLFTRKKEEKDVSKTVVRLWTNFAKSSDPTPNPGIG